jgi:hypothetical protein
MSTNPLRGFLAFLALVPLIWVLGCGKSSDSDSGIAYLAASPDHSVIFQGKTEQLAVTAHYTDGTTGDATSKASWVTYTPSVATVDSQGLVTGVGAGTAAFSAVLGGRSVDVVVNVSGTTFPVFNTNYLKDITFVPFGGSTNALTVDPAVSHDGAAASLRIDVPAAGYTGGAFKAATGQNLTLYNAVTFWVKASKAATLNVAGLGNDGANSDFAAEMANVPLTTDWTKVVLPVPNPAKLAASTGLFHFAEGAEEGAYSIWVQDIQYENLGASDLGAPASATIAWADANVELGKSQALASKGTITYTIPAVTVGNASLRWFDLTSSDPTVATVDASGLVSGVKLGTTVLSARLGALELAGSCTVTVITPVVPTVAPPKPTVEASKVISLLSTAYTNVPVDTWGASWSNNNAGPHLTDMNIEGDTVKKYASLAYVGVEFYAAGNTIDATNMTYLHLDVWTPDITDFHVKLVDFGAGATYGGGDDSESEVAVNASTTPALTGQKQWVSLNIPLASFGGLASRKHLAQLLFIGASPSGSGTVYIDNIYFHNSPFVDTIPPTVAITDSVPGSLATGDVTFTFTFSEDVGTSFTASSVQVTGGTAGTFAQTDTQVYTLVVHPVPDATGTLTVTVPAGAFQDLAQNANTASATDSQAYDTRVGILTPMDLPVVTFDSATVAYGTADFGGAASSIVTDPGGGTNKVVQVVKPTSAQSWAGTTLTADGTLGLGHPIPFSPSATRMSVRVYTPAAGIPVRLKVEDHANNAVTCEAQVTTTQANAWETLVFDFGTPVSQTAALDFTKTYDKVSIFFDFGFGVGGTAMTADLTCLFDDVAFDHFTTITFDKPAVAYTLTGFGGAENSSVAPDPAGGANNVAAVVKASGSETWAGTTLSLGTANVTLPALPFATGATRMLVRTYSPDPGIIVKLKAENSANGQAVFCEANATTTTANAWETLVFDFAHPANGSLDPAATYDKLSIFFDFGTVGTGKTYYFDDVTFDAFAGPVTFDSSVETYVLTGFGGAEGSSIDTDPSNSSNQVAKVVKISGAQTWAGVTVSTGANLTLGKIPFGSGSNNRFTLRVYSPASGTPFLLKVEDQADGNTSCQVQVATTQANAWETLTFDFTGLFDAAKTYDKVSVFPDFGVLGTGSTFYLDDLAYLP